ncbi:cytochrome P450 [Dactylosporangium sp. NBC_01737]|uniref:cytochrome P450 n=1 Tax=Dactylosporangium sp. NBC_01737 TaxID=2975959 RepID=UPI002E114C3A|nr:cytochrome P450 [Dactylosporangium sp. NBC_01737]
MPVNVLQNAASIPVYRGPARFARDPLGQLEAISARAEGAIVRLNLGFFRPFLVTRPDDVQHILSGNAGRYVREGMLWQPVRRLTGNGISGDGPQWKASREVLRPMFAARHVAALTQTLADTVNEAVDGLDEHATTGRPFDLVKAMTRVADLALGRAFFGGGIPSADGERLGQAVATAFTSLTARMLLPFAPSWAPLPGDRAFRRAVRTVDEVVYPLVAQRRLQSDGDDVVAMLCQVRDGAGQPLDDRRIRDDVVGMYVAGTETTAVALTWLWVALDADPAVAERLRAEVERVVGGERPAAKHLPELRYTRMVIQEVLRLYPSGWFLPRTVLESDVVGGVRLPAGSTVLLSPYLTHRMPSLWERPHVFDPERFAPERAGARHRFAYLPFAGGPHQCLGSQLFMAEAQLVVAAMLSRYRPRLRDDGPVRPRAAVTLRPSRRLAMTITRGER